MMYGLTLILQRIGGSRSMRLHRGSTWHKWDLHIHSPLSLLNNQFPHLAGGKADWEAYISKLEESDLSVVGITDYFTIDGYKIVRDFKQSGRLKNIDSILPNI